LGIVTTNDVLSAVLGRAEPAPQTITDVAANADVTIVSTNEFLVPGSIPLIDAGEMFGFHLDSDYYDTLAGWFMEQKDALPEKGDSLNVQGWVFTVETMDHRRIETLRLSLQGAGEVRYR
jgi:CBS domain containing-hemolysin-like protein